MKRFIKIFVIAAAMLALMSFGARAADGEGEYIVTKDGDEYILSAYVGTTPTPIERSEKFSDVTDRLSALSNEARVVFGGITVYESVSFSRGGLTLSGSLTLGGGAMLNVEGADINMSDLSLSLEGGSLRIKSGSVTLRECDITASNNSAVVLDYSSGAELVMESGSLSSSSDKPTLEVTRGSAVILGGSVKNTVGAAIESSSTLILSKAPLISGKEYGIKASYPITLSYAQDYFSGSLSVLYDASFEDGTISCVFYSASEEAIKNISLYDRTGNERGVRFFEEHGMLDERSVGAVYLPYTVNYYSDGVLLECVEALSGDNLSRLEAAARTGYRFSGWTLEDGGDGFYDFAKGVNGSFDLYAKYELLPPVFTISSLELTYDGLEHSFGISSISHPLADSGVTSYLWYKNGAYVSDSGPTLSLKSVSDSGSYFCKISFTYGKDTVTVTTPQVTVTVNKATVRIPEIADKYYTSEYQTPDIYTTSLYTVSDSGGIIVGVYPVKLTLTDKENYVFENGSDTAYSDFRILKADNFFTDEPSVFDIYVGALPNVNAASRFGRVEFLYSSSYDGAYASDFPTLSGTYFCIAKVEGTENYGELVSLPMEFSIRDERITGISIATMPTRCEYTAFDSFIADGLRLSVTYNSARVEIINADKISFSYQTAENLRYGDTAVIASYLDSSVAIPISVKKAEYNLSGLIFSDSESVFDGFEKTISYTGDIPLGLDGIPLSLSVMGGGKNAGVYTVVLSFSTSSKNYSVPTPIEATLTVKPVESEVLFSHLDFVYDGGLKVPEAYYVDIHGRKITLRVSGARSLAGEYTAVASGEDSNYRLVGASTVYKINKADYDLSEVVWSYEDFVYDGTEKSVTVRGLPSGVMVAGYSDNTATEAGKYTAQVTLLYDENNYNPPPALSFEWEIGKANYDLSVFSFFDNSPIYNGAEQYPRFDGSMPVGIDGESLHYRFIGGATHVSDGKVKVEIAFYTNSKNYNLPASMFAYVEIMPLGISAVWNYFEFSYDTSAHAPTAIAEECGVSVVGAATNAGSYTATAVSLDSDYYIINPRMDFVIHKAENLWTKEPGVSDIFEGSDPKVFAECLGGEVYFVYYSSDGKTEISTPDKPGSYYVSAVSDGNINYKPIKSDKLAFSVIKIAPVSMSVIMNKTDFRAYEIIGGGDITVILQNNDGSCTTLEIDEISVEYQNGGSLRFNDRYLTVSFLDFSEKINIEVLKADYDMSGVIWSESEFVYDGTEKTVWLLGLPSGVTVREYIGATGCAAGEYTVSAILDYDGENYNPPLLSDGVFVIKKQRVALPSVQALIYNGTAQKPHLAQSDLYTVSVSPETAAGRYEMVLELTDAENYEFADSTERQTVYYEILPLPITLKLSDIHKYKLSAMPTPSYSITEGDVIEGDKLLLRFSYDGGEVKCVSDNPNYLLSVIPGRIIRHDSLSRDSRFRLFLFILILLTLILMITVTILRRRDIVRFVSVVRCRFSPIAKATAPPPENKKSADNCIDVDSLEDSESCEPISDETVLNPAAIELAMSVDAERADSLITDSLAKDLVRREDIKVETCGRKKRIINVDTLSENFLSGDSVDVNKLKEMSLVPYDTAYIKVLARGMIDKPLKVYANDFSLAAVKMIALTGGEAVRVITVRKKDCDDGGEGEKIPENP